MDSPCIKQTVCKVLKIFQYGKYLVAYVLKLYLGGFTEYTYPPLQNSQEFAFDGGVIFDTLANSNDFYASGVFISAL